MMRGYNGNGYDNKSKIIGKLSAVLIMFVISLSCLAACSKTEEPRPSGIPDTSGMPKSVETPEPDYQSDAGGNSGDSSENPKEFVRDDLIVNGISYGASEEEVIAAFGEPETVEDIEAWESWDYFVFTYADGSSFLMEEKNQGKPLTLRSVVIVSDDFVGPRGIKVGDSMEKVIGSFRNDGLEENVFYYAENIMVYSDKDFLGPCGYIYDSEDYRKIIYCYPDEPYPEDIGEEYVYWIHGFLSFKIENGLVSEIYWDVSAFAE